MWCIKESEGTSAADDAFTIETVGFIEELFEHDELLPLLPHLMSMDELVANRVLLQRLDGDAKSPVPTPP
jgi:hypothetical protein